MKSGNVYQVNGFTFNKKYNTYISYGSDGSYVSWNKDTRCRYKVSEVHNFPIVAGD